jgi:hypothetical protein
MKLELIRRSSRNDYTCYRVRLDDKFYWKIYLPTNALAKEKHYMTHLPVERMVVFTAKMPVDDSLHMCHKCFKTYPRFQYAKHAKRYHK